MQDKSLDAMAKKYKEEMMRLYGQHSGGPSSPGNLSVSEKTSAPSSPSAADCKPPENFQTEVKTSEQSPQRDVERLEHPPMPKIPTSPQKSEENDKKIVENTQSQRFPSPDEIMAAELAQSESAPRFDNSNEDGHEQGNYEFTKAERELELEKAFADGEGYLKLEVSGGGQPLDCALVLVFRSTDGGDVLAAVFFTDEKGETEVITLPVLDMDEKYSVTVAKEGFYTVHGLDIPIFDSIKSIQPVELKCEK